jgi:hypothetical protein
MFHRLSTLALALSAIAFHTTASANLVRNGSFEDVSPAAGVQTQAPGTWSVYSAIDGWSTTSGSGIEVRNSVAGAASNGSNFVELDARSNSSMAQTILTAVGAYYNLSFDYSPRIGVAANSNGMDVLWNGVLLNLLPITSSGIGLFAHDWKSFSFGVVGTGSDVLSFRSVTMCAWCPSRVCWPASWWLWPHWVLPPRRGAAT